MSSEVVLEQLGRRLVDLVENNKVSVPPYPAVAARLRRVLGTPGYRIDDLIALIAGDQAISAQVLQVANSGLYLGLLKAASLRSAILRIGDEEVTRIAIGASLGTASRAPGPLVDLRRSVWRRSLIGAHLAHALSRHMGLPPDDMFMAALLHDFGSILAIASVESALASMPGFMTEIEDWEALIHRHHVALGMLIAKRWELPETVYDVIAMHHHAHPEGEHAAVVRFIQRIDALVSVIDKSVALTPEAFEPLGLAGGLVEEAIAAMPKIARQIASFEETPAKAQPSAIAYRTLSLGKPEIDVHVKGVVAHGGTKTQLQIRKAGPLGMLAACATRFASTQVVQMRLELTAVKALDMCVTAQLAAEERGSFVYELAPFAQMATVNRDYVAWLKEAGA